MAKKVSSPWLSGRLRSSRIDVEAVFVAAFDRRREQFDLDQIERLVPAVAQEIAHHPDVVGIVFDQQDSNSFFHHDDALGGNSTTSNQYLLRASQDLDQLAERGRLGHVGSSRPTS